MINKEQHSTNLAYIAKTLSDKPVTADLFKQILTFNANNLVNVKVVFPERCVPGVEFFKERESLGLVSKKDNIPESELNALDEAAAKDIYYQDY
jgi:hypothetical protein